MACLLFAGEHLAFESNIVVVGVFDKLDKILDQIAPLSVVVA